MKEQKQKRYPFGISKELYRLNVGMGLALFVIVAMTAMVLYIRAASLQNRKDTMSNQSTSGTSTHVVTFNLSGSNTFAAGEQIAVDFPETSAFTQAGTWVTADFAFSDGTARTIDAVNAGAGTSTVACTNGANTVGVAIDTAALVFRVIPCGGLFTPSAAGAFVTFTISGQSPGGTLTNPAVAGSYTIQVPNGAGDCQTASDSCSLAVSIVNSPSVSISATVTGTGGGGGPPPDTTPPIISGITVTGITETAATVNWSTNESADSLVNYGLTGSYGSQVSNPALVLSHSLSLAGLTGATLYHYQVCSKDAANNNACSPDATFTTADLTPPVISSVVVSGITTTGATITWTTNENATSFVDYATTAGPPYGSTSGNGTLVISHTVILSGLSPSTVYHYRVRSGDAASNEAFTTDATFTTASPPDTTPPVISAIAVTGITGVSATVTWTTDEPATSFVDYGTTIAYGSVAGNATLVTSHSVNLAGLTSQTLYHFRVRSADAATNEATSGDQTFTTLDVTPPVISGVIVSAITGVSATVSWTTNEPGSNFVDYGTTIAYGSVAGTPTPLQTNHSVNLTGLTSQTVYHFQVRSADAAGNSAVSADQTFTTLDVTAPVISAVAATAITTTGATITWTTNENADSIVDYGTTIAYGSTQSNASMLTSHSVPLTGLSPSTLYHFRVKSKDPSNNQSTTGDFTFTTLTPPDVTPPVISSIQVINISATGATVTWTTDEPSTSHVDYGTTIGYGSTTGNNTLVTSHSVILGGLTSQTLYHFRVRSADAASNLASSSDGTFSTLDVTAPIVTNVLVSAITETTATVTWTTNEIATSFVDYGTTVAYGTTAGAATPKVLSHSVNLTGLSPLTTYHFRVRSADVDNNETASTDDTFATIDTTPPVISAVTATNITTTGARITWTTNEIANSTVDHGTTIAYGSTQTNVSNVTSHQIDLTGLVADTTYHYRVKSKDPSNNQATSGDFIFKTVKPPPPVISAVTVTAITQTTATVNWTTDIAADSKVDYGQTIAYGNTRSSAPLVTSHSVNLDSMIKNRTYHYQVRSMDAYGQETATVDATFNTAADTTPPGNANPFTATAGNQQITLNWTNPVDPDFANVKIVRKTGSAPTGPTDGTQVYNSNGTSYVDAGLVNGTTYYYGAFTYDDVPNFASGAFASGTPAGPPDTTPPPNVSGFSAAPGNQQIGLTWTNPVDPDFVGVRIVRKTSGFPANQNDGTIVYSGSAQAYLDTGLTNGVTYYYKAFSYDGPLNFSSGVEVSGVPVAPPDTTPPAAVTNLKAVAGDAVVQLQWTNPTSPDWTGTRVVRKTGFDPANANDGIIVFDGAGDNKLDIGLVNDTEYHYAAFAYDPSLNFAAGAFATAKPKSGAVPPPPPACTDSDGGKIYDVQGTVSVGSNNYIDQCVDTATVTENFCEAAAQKSETHACGAGFKCAAGRCTPDAITLEVCGNGICAGSENSNNCAIDCPVIQKLPEVKQVAPTVTAAQKLGIGNIQFLATSARFRLAVENNAVSAYTGMTLVVYLPNSSIQKPIKTAFVNFGGSSYPMKQTHSFEASIVTPAKTGSYPVSVNVGYEDGTSDNVDATVITVPRGSVYEVIDGKNVAVGGARVTLLVDTGGGNYGLWDGAPSGQANPKTTGDDGLFNFIVPPGTYKLVAEKDAYITKSTLAFPLSSGNVITNTLLLIRQPENIQEAVVATTQQTVESVKEAINNPIVEKQAQQVAAPTAVAAAVANAAAAGSATATAVPYLLYVYSFFAHPTLLIARRRRKKWGIVYNALTKLPVDLAIVRLLDAKTGRIIRSAVTDKDGRYFFIVQPGEYKMTAVKVGFVFPTVYLKGAKEDVNFVDLYHGESIHVKEETAITANIPLDPVAVEKTPRKIMLEGIGRRFQKSLGVLSIAAMLISAIITPTPIMLALLAGNVVLYFVFRRLAITPTPKNWGIVYDDATGKPVQNVVARIFESKYNKLLETQVTDVKGRYAFLVGNNIYYVTFEKPGYQKQQKGPLDLTMKEKKKGEVSQLVAVDVKLHPAAGGAKPEEKKSALPPPPAGIGRPPEAPPSAVPPAATPAATPAAPAAPKPPEQATAAAVEQPMPAAPPVAKIPWEVQMLARLKKTQGEAAPPASQPAQPSTPSAPPPAPAAPPQQAKAAGSSYEEKMMARLKGMKAPEAPNPSSPTPPPPASQQAPVPSKTEPPTQAPLLIGKAEPLKFIQDVEHAHPETKLVEDVQHAHPDVKPVQDAAAAHPEEQRAATITPEIEQEDDNLPGPDDAVKEME